MEAIAPLARVVAAPPAADPVLPGPALLPPEQVFNGRDAWQAAVQHHLLALHCSVLDGQAFKCTAVIFSRAFHARYGAAPSVWRSTRMTGFLKAAQARGCRFQVGSDMLFEQTPARLAFFGFPSTRPEHLRSVAQRNS